MVANSGMHGLYLKSPWFVQNILLSLYGMYLQQSRTSGCYKKSFSDAIIRSEFGQRELKEYQLRQLSEILTIAEQIPYYREIFGNLRWKTSEIRDIDQIKDLPILEKQILRGREKEFVSPHAKKTDIISTTGTTGTPLKIFVDAESRRRHYAFYARFLALNNIDPHGRKMVLGGRIIMDSNITNSPFWRHSIFQKSVLFSSYHLNEKMIWSYIDKIKKERFEYIETYPSSIFFMAKYLGDRGMNLPLKAIITSGETLYPEQRSLIENVFCCPVYDHYGNAEMSVLIGQCRKGNYHYHSDYGLIEFLKGDRPARPGEEAEIVCTSFVNRAMPLIRYRIGDMAILAEEDCPCGLAFPVIGKVVGRTDDYIITPDGRKIGRLSPVLKGFPVVEAQYVQTGAGKIEVHLVKDQKFTANHEKEIADELRKRIGDGFTISFKYQSKLERGPGGKLKSVIRAFPPGVGLLS